MLSKPAWKKKEYKRNLHIKNKLWNKQELSKKADYSTYNPHPIPNYVTTFKAGNVWMVENINGWADGPL